MYIYSYNITLIQKVFLDCPVRSYLKAHLAIFSYLPTLLAAKGHNYVANFSYKRQGTGKLYLSMSKGSISEDYVNTLTHLKYCVPLTWHNSVPQYYNGGG